MLKALEFMQIPASKAISFGDRVIDIQASNAAGIESVACFGERKKRASCYNQAILMQLLDLMRY